MSYLISTGSKILAPLVSFVNHISESFGLQQGKRETPSGTKAEPNFFIYLLQIIAWPLSRFFQPCWTREKRARKGSRLERIGTECLSHQRGGVERLPNWEDDSLHLTHDDAVRYCSPDVFTRLEQSFRDILDRMQKGTEHPQREKLGLRIPRNTTNSSVVNLSLESKRDVMAAPQFSPFRRSISWCDLFYSTSVSCSWITEVLKAIDPSRPL